MKLVSYDEILINPIFERLETTYTEHLVEEEPAFLDLKKFTADDGTVFIGLGGVSFNKLTIDMFTGDSDVITEFEAYPEWDNITFISTDRNYKGWSTPNGNTFFRLQGCSCCDFDGLITESSE